MNKEIEELKAEIKELNDDNVWRTNRFNAVERDNRELKQVIERQDKEIDRLNKEIERLQNDCEMEQIQANHFMSLSNYLDEELERLQNIIEEAINYILVNHKHFGIDEKDYIDVTGILKILDTENIC